MTTAGLRVALVTGAGRGIGAAIAERLHGSGHRVALLDRDGDAVTGLSAALDPAGAGTALPLRADVDDTDAVHAALRETAAAWHAPDILINNAARTAPGSVWDIEPDEWDAVLTTNLRSVLTLTRLCAPAMRDRGWGRVVNLSSLAGQQGGTLAGAHYSAAKAGVLVLTKVFARELAAHGVTVNAVAPAAVDTPAVAGLGPSAVAEAARQIPVGRMGRPSEVAGLVAYLVGEEGGYVTGATFDINGGTHMR
ncbi:MULTISPECIES: SDR family oxidoreductase [Streptomyces]|uniref:SDR family NAD(P)-dependent oxidoreductase n=3 Tax=Streptomyces TaxID=1883 RepID=I2MTV8_STRT9|nr:MULTISPECIES: SDR family NAD(P)-dependent oxidoreductase [Streptomyces]ADU56314.1 short-chain dehydrogenase/reductase SDR [Streptomyces sp. KCTC 11604BP]ADX99516.1 FujI [Streptomyces sp. MJM7001]AZK92754.1 short-chain dehydrogenase [Streptomyces tsukubensis]EIF88205.1 3-oxoacyl-ACP reductase [Streptomyces tsukubensis NRRL18488]MYS65487.1 SDR family oxidoreductase [Streptomyces sp. SID5473]